MSIFKLQRFDEAGKPKSPDPLFPGGKFMVYAVVGAVFFYGLHQTTKTQKKPKTSSKPEDNHYLLKMPPPF